MSTIRFGLSIAMNNAALWNFLTRFFSMTIARILIQLAGLTNDVYWYFYRLKWFVIESRNPVKGQQTGAWITRPFPSSRIRLRKERLDLLDSIFARYNEKQHLSANKFWFLLVNWCSLKSTVINIVDARIETFLYLVGAFENSTLLYYLFNFKQWGNG